MSECHISGCRNIDTKCNDCGRTLVTRILPPAMDWISVKDKLPDEGQRVLTNRPASLDLPMEVDYLVYFEDGHKTWSCTREKEQSLVTHWMPLPHPPKE